MRLSIVTPSYNQSRFLEACIDSVLDQRYPDLEYLVMDGGSSDSSVDILKSYGERISWVSEPDGGQAAAVNKGIELASGEIIGWLNSDDIYYPGAFDAVMQVFENNPGINVVYGNADHIREDGTYIEDYYTEPWDYGRLKEICYICQPAVFFRKKIAKRVGMLNPKRQYAMDYDLWLRMGKNEAFYYLSRKLAGSRLYATNKTLGFVEPVHLDIMDAVFQNTGSLPERWLRGSAEAVARNNGYTLNTSEEHREYNSYVVSKIDEYSKRFNYNESGGTYKLPYSYAASMVIGIDASGALQEMLTDVGVAAKEIICCLAKNYGGIQYHIYPAMEDHIEPFCLDNDFFLSYPNIRYSYFSSEFNVINHLRVQFADQNVDEIDKMCQYPDVVLYPSVTFSCALASRSASVYIVHDLSFLEHVEYTSEENYYYCFENIYNASLKADYFVTLSEYTRSIFLEFFSYIDPGRVRVAYLGSKETYKNKPQDHDIQGVNADIDTKYWLFVGTGELRKNLISLLHAYADLRQSGVTMPLYIACCDDCEDALIKQSVDKLKLNQNIIFLGNVTDKQLNVLYRNCYALIYPFYYEGSGQQILDAMTAGAPVIASNVTSMPEVGGDAAIYIDPADRKAIKEAMYMLYHNPEKREEMKKKSVIQSLKFGWRQAAGIIQKTMVDAVINPRNKPNNTKYG